MSRHVLIRSVYPDSKCRLFELCPSKDQESVFRSLLLEAKFLQPTETQETVPKPFEAMLRQRVRNGMENFERIELMTTRQVKNKAQECYNQMKEFIASIKRDVNLVKGTNSVWFDDFNKSHHNPNPPPSDMFKVKIGILRIYGIYFDTRFAIITGYGVKVTENMQATPWLVPVKKNLEDTLRAVRDLGYSREIVEDISIVHAGTNSFNLPNYVR
jgi:hypothetical protein